MRAATELGATFDTVLVATDLGQEAERALAYAKAMTRNSNGKLLLAHVSRPVMPTFIPEGGWIDDAADVERDEINLKAAAIALRAEGLNAKSVCGYGGVSDELARQVRESHADLVVAGTHGRRGLARLFAGSNAEGIASTVPVPVMIVGPKCAIRNEAQWLPKFLLCGVSLNEEGVHVARYACRLARAYDAVVSVGYSGGEKLSDGQSQAGAGGRGMYGNWESFKTAVLAYVPFVQGTRPALHGVPMESLAAESLVDLAVARDADLLMVGVRHKLIEWPSLGRGVLPRLLAEAPCPVMTVPTEEQI